MLIHISMLLIIKVVAVIALIQAYFPAMVCQGEKLSRPELMLFRVGSAVYFHFELTALKFRWKRILYFIRAVLLPVRSSLHIAAGLGKRCAARASAVETVISSAWSRGIRAYACDIFNNSGIANSLLPAPNLIPVQINVDYSVVIQNRVP